MVNVSTSTVKIKIKSNRFLERWDSILFDCSTRLLILLYQNTLHNLEVLDKTITNIKTDLSKSLTFSDTNNINERLQDIHNIQSLKLREKQPKKLLRDGINRRKIYHQNYQSLLWKRQGGSEDFQDTKKLIETKMTQSSICHQKI